MLNPVLSSISSCFTSARNMMFGGHAAQGAANAPNHIAQAGNGAPTHRPGKAMTTGAGAANQVFNPENQTLTPYETQVMALRENIYRQDGDAEVAAPVLSKAEQKAHKALEKKADAHLKQLSQSETSGAKESYAGAKACLNAMKPEVRHQFIQMLAAEHDMPIGFTESGLSVNEWSDLFGGLDIPCTINTQETNPAEWQMIRLPNSIRSVSVDSLKQNDVHGAWGAEGAQHTIDIRDSIMENGLNLNRWTDWSGGGTEGRHRSSAGYLIANDVLHPLLMRFPAHDNALNNIM